MISVLDSGNTYTKIGLFEKGKLIKIYQKDTFEQVLRTLRRIDTSTLVSGSVNLSLKQIQKEIPEASMFVVDTSTPIPFRIDYRTPDTLGIDRLAAVACAWNKKPGHNLLVIDAGTCITYDFIGRDGIYLGGGISPGLDVRFKALHEHTSGLPVVSLGEAPSLIGKDTRESILSGVVHGTVSEIDGIIQRYMEEFEDLTIFMSGGSAFFFETRIKHRIFAIPNMVLWGLFSIYEYNARKR